MLAKRVRLQRDTLKLTDRVTDTDLASVGGGQVFLTAVMVQYPEHTHEQTRADTSQQPATNSNDTCATILTLWAELGSSDPPEAEMVQQ